MRELQAVMRGAAERARREHDARAWAVWHAAALPKMRTLPPLTRLQAPRWSGRRMGDAEMERALRLSFGAPDAAPSRR